MTKSASNWSWREGEVKRASDHFELRNGSAKNSDWDHWLPVALVGRPQEREFKVQFLVDRTDKSKAKIVRALVDELNFYLIEKNEPNPWAYAQYHCSTMANVYSSIHWSFFPKGVRRVTTYAAKLDVQSEQNNEEALCSGKITNIKPI